MAFKIFNDKSFLRDPYNAHRYILYMGLNQNTNASFSCLQKEKDFVVSCSDCATPPNLFLREVNECDITLPDRLLVHSLPCETPSLASLQFISLGSIDTQCSDVAIVIGN